MLDRHEKRLSAAFLIDAAAVLLLAGSIYIWPGLRYFSQVFAVLGLMYMLLAAAGLMERVLSSGDAVTYVVEASLVVTVAGTHALLLEGIRPVFLAAPVALSSYIVYERGRLWRRARNFRSARWSVKPTPNIIKD